MLRKLIIASAFLAACVWLFAGNIKTVDGVARANIKTLAGVASANLKTISDVDSTTAAATVTADLWQTFEFDTLSEANLAANDNCADGTWTITDASSKLSMTTDGELATVSTVNSTSDSGTRGIGYLQTDGAAAYVSYLPASDKDNISVGFWYKTGAPANYTAGPQLLRLEDSSGTAQIRIYDRRNSGSNNRELALLTPATQVVNCADSTWYWVTATFHKNTTGSWQVFTAAGAAVASAQTFTCANSSVDEIIVFATTGPTADTETVYADDLIMDWTDATTPLGP